MVEVEPVVNGPVAAIWGSNPNWVFRPQHVLAGNQAWIQGFRRFAPARERKMRPEFVATGFPLVLESELLAVKAVAEPERNRRTLFLKSAWFRPKEAAGTKDLQVNRSALLVLSPSGVCSDADSVGNHKRRKYSDSEPRDGRAQ